MIIHFVEYKIVKKILEYEIYFFYISLFSDPGSLSNIEWFFLQAIVALAIGRYLLADTCFQMIFYRLPGYSRQFP